MPGRADAEGGRRRRPWSTTRVLDRLTAAPDVDVIWYDGRWLSAGDLRAWICGAAQGLASLGIGRDGVVAALTEPNHPLMLAIRYAASLLGARIVYVRSVNPRTEEVGLTQAQRAEIMREVQADVLFADRASLSEALDLVRRCDRAVPVCAFAGAGSSLGVVPLLAADALPPGAGEDPDPDRIAAVIYTSGTSGAPKGVCMSFGAWDSMVDGFSRAQGRPLTFLAVTPISQAVSTMLDGCLAAGGSVILHPEFDAGSVLAAIADQGVTAAYMAVPHLYELLDHPHIEETDVSGMACLIYSGTPASPSRMEQAAARFGTALIQSYGTTEAGPISVLLPMAHRSPDLRLTVGRPLPGVRIRIRDPRAEVDLDVGATGEVWVRSATVMSGYLGGQAGGSVALEDGWLRTGDLGTIDSRGYLSLLGRVGDVIKCRGIKVFPSVVEEALASHPDVSHAHVFGRRVADDVEQVHAAVVLRPDTHVSFTELHERVAARLSPLHAPDVITLWEALPVTANGKPDRRLIAGGAPPPSGGRDAMRPATLARDGAGDKI